MEATLYVLLYFMLCISIEEYVLFRIKQQTDHVLCVYRTLYNASHISGLIFTQLRIDNCDAGPFGGTLFLV